MTRARDLADSADKDIAGTLTLDGLTVDGSSTLDDIKLTAVALPASGNPSIALRNTDSNIYIQSGSGNAIALLDSSQNSMLIAAATSHSLQISNGNAFSINSGRDISFYDDQGSSQSFYWDASAESLGIGTSSPSSRIELVGTNFTDSTIRLQRTDSGVNNDAGLQFTANAGANSGHGMGGIWFKNSLDSNAYALIRARTDDATGTSGRLDFITSTSSVGNTTAPSMTIDSSGNVGIGTDSPEHKLHVKSTSPDEPIALFESDTGSGGDISIRLEGGASGNPEEVYIEFSDRDDPTNSFTIGLDDDASKLFFGYGSLGTTNGHRQMVLQSDGNVGIGVADPDQKLEVNGVIKTSLGSGGLSLSGYSSPDMGYFGYNYFNNNGTETVGQSARSSHRIGMGNGGTNAITFDYRAPSAAAGAWSEAMRIDSSGNVGIGNTSPQRELHIGAADNTNHEAVIVLNNGGATGYRAGLEWRYEGNTTPRARISVNASNQILEFDTAGSERMRIDSSGILSFSETSSASFPARSINAYNNGYTYFTGGANGLVLKDAGASGSRVQINSSTMQFETNGSEAMRIDSIGNILSQYGSTTGYSQTSGNGGMTFVNDTDSTGGSLILTNDADNGWSNIYMNKFEWVSGDDTRFIQFWVNGSSVAGSINVVSATTVAYNTSSDYRLKTDVQPMTGATDRLKQLNPVNFEWIGDGTRVDGFLAHEAQAVVPQSVTGTKDAMREEEYEVTPAVTDDDGNVTTEAVMDTRSVPDYQGIDQSKLVPLLVATIKELEARITTLENA